jgi:hypothetical protein
MEPSVAPSIQQLAFDAAALRSVARIALVPDPAAGASLLLLLVSLLAPLPKRSTASASLLLGDFFYLLGLAVFLFALRWPVLALGDLEGDESVVVSAALTRYLDPAYGVTLFTGSAGPLLTYPVSGVGLLGLRIDYGASSCVAAPDHGQLGDPLSGAAHPQRSPHGPGRDAPASALPRAGEHPLDDVVLLGAVDQPVPDLDDLLPAPARPEDRPRRGEPLRHRHRSRADPAHQVAGRSDGRADRRLRGRVAGERRLHEGGAGRLAAGCCCSVLGRAASHRCAISGLRRWASSSRPILRRSSSDARYPSTLWNG